MKKILAVILALTVCASMFACGTPAETTGEVSTTEAVDTTGAVVTTEAVVSTEEVVTTEAVAPATSIEELVGTIDAVLSTMKNGTVEEYAALTGMAIDNADPMTAQMVEAMFKKFDYTLGTATQLDDTHATVDATITSLDIMSALMSYMTVAGQAEDPENFDADGAIFMSMLTAEDAATVTNDIKINLEKVDGAWTLSEENSDFTNALSGGLAG